MIRRIGQLSPFGRLVALAGAMIVSVVVAVAAPRSALPDDISTFMERTTAIVEDGRAPYVDAVFEHFPAALLPMLASHLASTNDTNVVIYAVVFALLMGAAIVATSGVVDRSGRAMDDPDAYARWFVVTLPLLPLVLFRVDPWSVACAAAAIAALAFGRSGVVGWSLAGIAVKGWPAVIGFLALWRTKTKEAAAILVPTGLLTVWLLSTPGFSTGRSFGGIHLETVVGSLLGLMAAIGGGQGIVGAAGATYVEAPPIAVAVNALVGVACVLYSQCWRRVGTPREVFTTTGMVVAGLLLTSPLLSAQFLLWLTPFVIFARKTAVWRLLAAINVLTVVLIGHWSPFEVWWHAVIVARNLVLVSAAVLLARSLRHGTDAVVPAERSATP